MGRVWPAAWHCRASRRGRRATAPVPARRSAHSRAMGSRWGQKAGAQLVDDRRAADGRSSGTRPRRSGGGPCRSSTGTRVVVRTTRHGERHWSASRTLTSASGRRRRRPSRDATDGPVRPSTARGRSRSAVGRGHAAASIASRAALHLGTAEVLADVPSLRTTRWQGTTSGIGLWAQALPTARTAFGLPAAAATGRSCGRAVADVGEVRDDVAAEPGHEAEVERQRRSVRRRPAKYSSSWRATSSVRGRSGGCEG